MNEWVNAMRHKHNTKIESKTNQPQPIRSMCACVFVLVKWCIGRPHHLSSFRLPSYRKYAPNIVGSETLKHTQFIINIQRDRTRPTTININAINVQARYPCVVRSWCLHKINPKSSARRAHFMILYSSTKCVRVGSTPRCGETTVRRAWNGRGVGFCYMLLFFLFF